MLTIAGGILLALLALVLIEVATAGMFARPRRPQQGTMTPEQRAQAYANAEARRARSRAKLEEARRRWHEDYLRDTDPQSVNDLSR